MTQKDNSIQKCSRCGKRDFITDNETGEIFCGKCGYVIPEQANEINTHPISAEESRTGSPTSLAKHDMGLSTLIGSENTDATGKPISSDMRQKMQRIKFYDNRSNNNPSTDRSYKIAFNYLHKFKDKLMLPGTVVENAAYIYRKAVEKKLVRGRSILALMAAAVYAACRNTAIPRNLKDFEQVGNIKRKDIGKCYRVLVRELDLKMPVTNPVQCIPRIAGKIRILEKTKRHAMKILKTVYDSGMAAGKDPMGLAAGALYLACIANNENVTQRIISKSANVTEVTVRTRYQWLKKIITLKNIFKHVIKIIIDVIMHVIKIIIDVIMHVIKIIIDVIMHVIKYIFIIFIPLSTPIMLIKWIFILLSAIILVVFGSRLFMVCTFRMISRTLAIPFGNTSN